jgi:hypothetical protein
MERLQTRSISMIGLHDLALEETVTSELVSENGIARLEDNA